MAEQDLPPQPLFSVTGPLTAGFSQSVLQGTLNGAANSVSQLALKVIQYIQGVLADAVNTGSQLALKVATPIASAINQAQEVINQTGQQIANQAAAGIASATGPCASGCEQQQGASYNQYQYNILQDFDVPASVFVENRDYPISKTFANLCFRGGWDSFYDAIAYKQKIQGSPPPPGCAKPGGPATGPGTGPTTPTIGYFGGCQNGQVIVWTTLDKTPEGVTGVVGPFATALQASLSVTVTCTPGATGNYWVICCPQSADCPKGIEVVNGIAGVSSSDILAGPMSFEQAQATYDQSDGGKCVGPITPPTCPDGSQPPCVTPPPPPECLCVNVNWPKCLDIDLCDWKKFEDSLYKALCRFYEDCICKLTNEQHWELSDCDGELATVIDPWKGEVVKIATDSTPDEIMAMGRSQIAGAGWENAGTNPDPWR